MHDAFNRLGKIYFSLCKEANTPISLGCWLRFKYRCYDDLATMSVTPANYTSANRFAVDYGVVSYLSKYEKLPTSFDVRKVAALSFRASEESCRVTNDRLRRARFGLITDWSGVFHAARRKIARVLGSIDIMKIAGLCKWGPGATYCLKRRESDPDKKMYSLPISVTPLCLPYARAWLDNDPHWFASITGVLPEGPYSVINVFDIVECNRIVFVPKSAKTARTIAIEPRFNSLFQQGVGRFIRGRLKTVGIDLDDQSVNQTLAARAYFEGLATIDLAAASDTVSVELVKELLPFDWYNLLNAFRSPNGELGDEKFVYQKFSSMGNAFTFELETLIFWSLARALQDTVDDKGRVSVYGDDIICEQTVAEQLIQLLAFAGFKTNASKSFISGAFYESCGKHFFHGVEVTPLYQKEEMISKHSFFRAHNRLVRWSARLGITYEKTLARFRQLALDIFGNLPFYVSSDGFGDDAWLVPISQNTTARFRVVNNLIEWVEYSVLRVVFSKRRGRDSAMYALWLRNHNNRKEICSVEDDGDGLIPVIKFQRERPGKLSIPIFDRNFNFYR